MLRQAQHERMWGAAIALLLLATPAAAQQVAPASPTIYQRAIAAGYKAAMLCSGILNARAMGAERTQASVEANELRGIYPQYDALIAAMPAQVGKRAVSVTYDGAMPSRIAWYRDGRGCTVLPIGADAPESPPMTALAPPAVASAYHAFTGRLAGVVDRAFSRDFGQGSNTTAILVLRNGKPLGERYADGFGPNTPQRTWSVGKSIAGTLVGLSRIDPEAPAGIANWHSPSDPRRAITNDQLMRMASGLHSDTAGNRTDALYFGGTAISEQAPGWPLEAMPGTRFRYANNDILLAMLSVKARLGDAAYSDFPSTALFGPIGMTRTVAETDWRGDYMLSSQVWSTARDFARLGQFWLDDGVWQGKRLLPEGWMTYMTTPSGPQPGGDGPGYGATLWLFGPKQGLPDGSYAAQGNRGQYIMVIPSRKLIVVRRGEDPGAARFDIARFTAEVIEATR